MKEIKIFKRNMIGKNDFGSIVMMDSTGRFNPLSVEELYELIQEDKEL